MLKLQYLFTNPKNCCSTLQLRSSINHKLASLSFQELYNRLNVKTFQMDEHPPPKKNKKKQKKTKLLE